MLLWHGGISHQFFSEVFLSLLDIISLDRQNRVMNEFTPQTIVYKNPLSSSELWTFLRFKPCFLVMFYQLQLQSLWQSHSNSSDIFSTERWWVLIMKFQLFLPPLPVGNITIMWHHVRHHHHADDDSSIVEKKWNEWPCNYHIVFSSQKHTQLHACSCCRLVVIFVHNFFQWSLITTTHKNDEKYQLKSC